MKHDPINHPSHYNAHPSGVECIEIAEYMGFNLGNAFKYLWRAGLKGNHLEDLRKALWYLNRYDQQRGPLPLVLPHIFRDIMGSRRVIFNRPSVWGEPVRHALAAICDICTTTDLREKCRLTEKAMHCTETAIADEGCIGRGQEP